MELLASLGAAHLVGHERTRLAGVVLAARTAQHELNNRLTRVVGYAELLSCEADLAPEARRMVEMVLEGASDAADLVTRMGSVARLEEVDWGGGVGLDDRPGALAGALAAAAARQPPLADALLGDGRRRTSVLP